MGIKGHANPLATRQGTTDLDEVDRVTVGESAKCRIVMMRAKKLLSDNVFSLAQTWVRETAEKNSSQAQ